MKANTLDLFEIFRKSLGEDDARKVVNYLEDTNETEIVRTVERKVEHLATKEDLANVKAELGKEIVNVKADIIKWMFLFWVGQLGAMIAFLYYFLQK